MTNPLQLPVIDITNPDDPVVGRAMLDGAIKYGFFYVASQGSGLTAKDLDEVFELSKKFFASPREEKATCSIHPNNRGWIAMREESLNPEHNQKSGDPKEAINIGDFRDGKAQQPLPPSLAPHEAQLDRFLTLCNETCARVLRLLALGLEIPPEFFLSRHGPSNGSTGTTLRFLYYPSLKTLALSNYRNDVDIRAGAHSDYGSITLLFQRPRQAGLEIRTPEGGWAGVPVWPSDATAGAWTPSRNGTGEGDFPPIVINVGDLLSYWTYGLLKSTVHRVVFTSSERAAANTNGGASESCQDRYSIAFFCHPVDDAELLPVPSPVVAEHQRNVMKNSTGETKIGYGPGSGSLGHGRRLLTAKDHLFQRLNATYGFQAV